MTDRTGRHFILDIRFSEGWVRCGHETCTEPIYGVIDDKKSLVSRVWQQHLREMKQGAPRESNALLPPTNYNRSRDWNGGQSQATATAPRELVQREEQETSYPRGRELATARDSG